MSVQKARKKSAAPAAQAFFEALEDTGQSKLMQEPEALAPERMEQQARADRDESYAWDDDESGRGGGADAPFERAFGGAAPPALAAPPPPGGPPMPPQAPPPLGAAMPARTRAGATASEMSRRQLAPKKVPPMSSYPANKTSEELQLESSGPRVVETGFWIWRNVIVAPNVYVVHTRRGRPDPVTLGLGKSFRYNPLTDSYLVVPAAMQTIGIFARCISAEKQGIHVLAYVQWLISDFALAYKRLDFSDANDPTGIVNSQLREQAEAAIKDTVSTMTVEQVLTDKAPIIQELTERMKNVAEGRDGDGLGLKIVTVQIKEAVVASATLFENLQAPYRHEKDRMARLSAIESESQVQARAREAEVEREAADARASSEIARLRAQTELSTAEASLAARTRQEELSQKAEQTESGFRHETELASLEAARETAARQQAVELERLQAAYEHASRNAALAAEQELVQLRAQRHRDAETQRLAAANELEAQRLQTAGEQEAIALREQLALARAASEATELEARERVEAARRLAERTELEARIATDRVRHEARLKAERENEEQRLSLAEAAQRVADMAERQAADVERVRQETANAKSDAAVRSELVAALPELASHMPDIQEYRYVGVSDGQNGSAFNALPEFLAKAMGVAQSFGWKFGQESPPKQD